MSLSVVTSWYCEATRCTFTSAVGQEDPDDRCDVSLPAMLKIAASGTRQIADDL
jgi:hypothetical protein